MGFLFATGVDSGLNVQILGIAGLVFLVIVVYFIRKGTSSDAQETIESQTVQEDGASSSGRSKTSESKQQKRGRNYHKGLQKSRGFLAATMDKLFGSGVDESILEELEETLLMADVGIHTTSQIID